jgi:hypothetical protein
MWDRHVHVGVIRHFTGIVRPAAAALTTRALSMGLKRPEKT